MITIFYDKCNIKVFSSWEYLDWNTNRFLTTCLMHSTEESVWWINEGCHLVGVMHNTRVLKFFFVRIYVLKSNNNITSNNAKTNKCNMFLFSMIKDLILMNTNFKDFVNYLRMVIQSLVIPNSNFNFDIFITHFAMLNY